MADKPDSPPEPAGWLRTAPSTALWNKTKPLARQMRHAPTRAERRLWSCLRGHRLSGFKFRRQHPIDRFIVDFTCPAARLVIEVDGPSHEQTI
jgi:very-short-patch-repair endonuclease